MLILIIIINKNKNKKMKGTKMNKIKLKNVRLSFPSLFNKAVFDGVQGKFEATFLISKEDKKTMQILNDRISEILKETKLKIPKEKICLKDGDFFEYDGYENCFSLKASSLRKPLLIDVRKNQIVEEDEIFYPGCYVNAIIDFWVQNNRFGKRINANLYGVQFFRDGESFLKNNSNSISEEFETIDVEQKETAEIAF